MIKYREFYNAERGLPEPKWGPRIESLYYALQCPTCGSHEMHASASPGDPEEIFSNETVRCKNCGSITDWYEALTQYRNHYTKTPLEVER